MMSAAIRILFALCLLLVAYPVLGGLGAKSESPVFFGRYSTYMLLFVAAGLALLAAGALALAKNRLQGRWPVFILLGLIAFSVAAFGSNGVASLPMFSPLMWLARLSGSLALLLIAFQAFRSRAKAGFALAAGVIVLLLCLVDAAFALVIRSKPSAAALAKGAYRYNYDLAQIGPNDIVLAGDSYVWGCGVEDGREFGALLQQKLPQGSRTWMLGVIGSNVPVYTRCIQSIPADVKARRIVVCCYHNDMPEPGRFSTRLMNLSKTIGKAMPSMIVVSDLLAKAQSPTASDYLHGLAENGDPKSAHYAERFALLKSQLADCHAAAKPRSLENPALLIIPVLLPFQDHEFDDDHERIAKAASDIGFEPWDPLDAFKRSGIPAEKLWAAADDPHFNEAANRITADFLAEKLTANSTAIP